MRGSDEDGESENERIRSFSFIMRMPSVCKQPPGIGFGLNLGCNLYLVYPPSGPSYNIVVILYKYPNCGSGSSIA